MKKLTLILLAATLSLPALAQTGTPPATGPARNHSRSPEQMSARRLQMLTKHLNLSSDQQAQVKKVLDDEQSQSATLRQDTSLAKKDRRAKLQELQQSTQSQIRNVLNSDQQAKYDEMQQKMKARAQARRQGRQSQGTTQPQG